MDDAPVKHYREVMTARKVDQKDWAQPAATAMWATGELDLASAPQLERALARAKHGRPATLVLDLRDVSFLDSCGLRELLGAQRACEEAGCALTLIAGAPARRSILTALLQGLWSPLLARLTPRVDVRPPAKVS